MTSISIQSLAIILMVAHVIADIFMGRVLFRQYGLFAVKFDDLGVENRLSQDIKNFRRTLFTLSVIVFAGNIVPVVVDAITVFSDNALHRNPEVPLISIIYAVSNALVAIISAYLIFTLYRIAKASNDPNELVEKTLESRQ